MPGGAATKSQTAFALSPEDFDFGKAESIETEEYVYWQVPVADKDYETVSQLVFPEIDGTGNAPSGTSKSYLVARVSKDGGVTDYAMVRLTFNMRYMSA